MDRRTLDFYQNHSAEWIAALPEDGARRKRLGAFLALLPAGSRILELGCGDGRDAQAMLAQGFQVDASDGSPEMARIASERLGRPVPVMDFAELAADGIYDGVWCHASLLHVEERDLPAILNRIHRALKPGGWHFANFKGGTGGHRDDFGRFYSYLPADRLENAYRGSGVWARFHLQSNTGGSFGGVPTLWHEVLVRK